MKALLEHQKLQEIVEEMKEMSQVSPAQRHEGAVKRQFRTSDSLQSAPRRNFIPKRGWGLQIT